MGKHEPPPFKMVIERGKLVPATPYDAERLDGYRNGVRVNVRFTEDRDRVMVRKWWAVIGRAVKECKTPWQNKEQASEAIKLALGIVNLSKTVGGAWLQYPKSLTEIEDPELTEAVERMIDVIYNVTGVDASVWRKHVENIRDEETPSDAPPSDGEGSDGNSPGPADNAVAAANSEMPPPAGETIRSTQDGSMEAAPETGQSTVGAASHQPEPPAADQEGGDNPGEAAPPSDLIALKRECISKFLTAATDPSVPDAKDRQETVVFAKDAWKASLPTEADFVKACFETTLKVVRGELKEAVARRYLEGLL